MIRRWSDLSVGRKVVVPYVMLTLVVGLLVSAVASQQVAAASGEQTSLLALREQNNVNTILSSLEERQLGELRLLTATTGVAAAVEKADQSTLTRLLLPLAANELPERLQVSVVTRAGDEVLGLQADPTRVDQCVCDLRPVHLSLAHLTDVLAGKADRYGTRYVGLAKQPSGWQLYTVGPLIDTSGYLAGAIVVSESLSQVVSQIQRGAQVGMALFGPDGTQLGSTGGLQYSIPALGELDRSAAMQGNAAVVRSVSAGSHPAQIFYVPWVMRYQPIGYMGLVVPSTPVAGGQLRVTFFILGICVVALLLTLVVGSVVARSITQPMAALITATNEVAKGRLDYRPRVEALDEIGRLTASFNDMVGVLSERTDRLERFSEETLLALASAIDARDPYTLGHSMRVAAYSHLLARTAGLLPEEIEAIRRGCLVHDIGKIGVSDKILRKEGPLNRIEQAQMREHPVIGHRMISRLDWERQVFDVVLHHHERWDGQGYPQKLKADGIPLVARVVAIADALDAMTSMRPYRAQLTFTTAFDQISHQAGEQFDPSLIRALKQARRELSRLARMLGRNTDDLRREMRIDGIAAEAGAVS